MTVNQTERDQLTKYRRHITLILFSNDDTKNEMSDHCFIVGTLLEAAGLLLSIVFHWLIMGAFNVSTKGSVICNSTDSNQTESLRNIDSLMSDISDLTKTSNDVASNVVSKNLLCFVFSTE